MRYLIDTNIFIAVTVRRERPGGKRAFQKYESGAVPPSDAAVGLIELLIRHPEEVETLRAMRAGEFRGAA